MQKSRLVAVPVAQDEIASPQTFIRPRGGQALYPTAWRNAGSTNTHAAKMEGNKFWTITNGLAEKGAAHVACGLGTWAWHESQCGSASPPGSGQAGRVAAAKRELEHPSDSSRWWRRRWRCPPAGRRSMCARKLSDATCRQISPSKAGLWSHVRVHRPKRRGTGTSRTTRKQAGTHSATKSVCILWGALFCGIRGSRAECGRRLPQSSQAPLRPRHPANGKVWRHWREGQLGAANWIA